MRLVVALVIVLSGCDSVFGCKQETQVIEVVPGDPFFNSRLAILDGYKANGWHCTSEAIRNASGQSIGDRYTCTKC